MGVRPLRHDGQPYHGVNVLTLWAEVALRYHSVSVWMTFRQALALGGAVRKGEKASAWSTPTVWSARILTLQTELPNARSAS